ncbi:hypothetical protein E2542_SST29984 [Spatholobus suberectus]|nr:hypothetical protein E2542_SST29984 [Spatholobus suberectus]
MVYDERVFLTGDNKLTSICIPQPHFYHAPAPPLPVALLSNLAQVMFVVSFCYNLSVTPSFSVEYANDKPGFVFNNFLGRTTPSTTPRGDSQRDVTYGLQWQWCSTCLRCTRRTMMAKLQLSGAGSSFQR